MAQSVTDIEAQIDTEKANHPELNDLDSTSSTAIWQLWKYIVAQVTVYFEQVMDLFKANIQNIVNNNQYGNDAWWYNKLLAFQYGDSLVYLNNIFQYALIDPTKQIIGFCSVSSLNGIVQIKVAQNIGGIPTVLTTDQYNGVVSYCSQIQPSGIRWAVLSLPADLLKCYVNIYYDAAGDITVIQPAVILAIQNYLLGLNSVQTTSGTPVTQNFNGTLFINKMIDSIQAVPNVIGNQCDVLSIAAKNGGSDYTNFTSSYQPESGYFTIDPDSPLSATLTFIPYVAS